MRRMLAILCVGCGWVAGGSSVAQTPEPTTSNSPSTAGASVSPPIYRDPRTGQLYQQELQTVDQPVTTWQRKLVNRTVVTPQTVIENQQVPQTYYVAKTEYVWQSKLKGWWNPFAQPTYAYEYVPVTRWVPQTQMVTRQVPTTKLIATNEQVPVDEPVQTTQKVTSVVMRPLPASAATNSAIASNTAGGLPPGAVTTNAYAGNAYAANSYAANPYAYSNTLPPARLRPAPVAPPVGWSAPAYAQQAAYGRSNSQPLVASVPILGRQPTQPTQPGSFQPGSLLTAPVNGLRSIVRATTAPFNGQSNYNTYAQPMNVASAPNSNWGRDFNQGGMPATVVR